MSPEDAEKAEYFSIASPLAKDVFLRLSRDIVEDSLLLCAPLGGSRLVRRVTPTEAAFTKAYGPRWRATLEGVTELAYTRHNVSEGEVAVTIQQLVQEDGDEEAASAVRAMANALATVYSPPAVVELPRVLPPGEFSDLAEELHTLAVPLLATTAATASASSCCTAGLAAAMYPEAFVALSFTLPGQGPVRAGYDDAVANRLSGVCGDAAEPEDGVFAAAAKATAATASAKERVRTSAAALGEARAREPARWDGMRQEHFQALAEAYAAPDGGGLASPGETAAAAAAASVADSVASEYFLCDPLFAAVFAAEAAAAAATAQPHDSGNKHGGSTRAASLIGDRLDDIYAAARLARSAELLAVDENLSRAAEAYSEAVATGFGAVPDCLLAGFIANRGLCRLAAAAAAPAPAGKTAAATSPSTQAALDDAEAALGLDRRCAAAYACRGRCRRLNGDALGGMRDAVRSHVLEAAAGTGEATEGGPKAVEIEAAARAAVEAAAAESFAKRQPVGELPPRWLMRSYFESFGGEEGDQSRESDFVGDDFEDEGGEEKADAFASAVEPPCGASAAAAFCRRQLRLGYEHKQAEEYEEAHGSFAAAAAAAVAAAGESSDAGAAGEQTAEIVPPRLASRALEENASFLHLCGDHGAAEAFRAAVDRDPANGMARVKLGAVLADMGRKREALAEFATVLADTEGGLYDGDATRRRAAAAAAFLHRGQLRLLEGENTVAAADFERSVALDGDVPAAAASWGIALFKEAQAAAAAAEAATAAGAGAGELAARRASAATERALGVLATAVDEFPGALEPRLFYSEALTQAGDFGGALGILKEAAELGEKYVREKGEDSGRDGRSAKHSGGSANCGAGGSADGDGEGARGKAGDDDRCPLPYAFAGRAYMALNDVAAARRHLLRALQIDPGCSSALLDMGQLHMQEGDTAAALRLYRRGVQSSRYLSEMHDALACYAIAMAHVQALAEFAE